MTWPRAALASLVLVAVTFFGLVVMPNMMLTRLTSHARGTRVGLATAWFTGGLVVLLWGLRRIQARLLPR